MDFLPFFIVLLVSILFSVAFRRFHLPWVLALITGGIVIGPSGFNLITTNPTIDFIGGIGLVFLMFMAGLETKLSSFKKFRRGIVWLTLLNAGIPFAVGYWIGFLFQFSTLGSLLLGIIFMSSSIAVIVPTLEARGLIHTKLGKSIVSATIIADVLSLIALSILLQSVNPVTALPLPSFYVLLLVILIAFRYGLPRIRNIIPKQRNEQDLFESEVRIIIALLIGVVVVFELLGLHPIIAGFFAGLVLSDSIKSDILVSKLRTISYGIFIPVFFILIGMNTDIGVFLGGGAPLLLIFAVVLGSVFSKFISGYIGGRMTGFNKSDAYTIGVATIPQLSTTLAVVFTAVELGIIADSLITAMVILSVTTTLIAPILLKLKH